MGSLNSLSCSSKLIETREGVVGTSNLYPVSQKQRWQPGLMIDIYSGGQSGESEPLTCGIWYSLWVDGVRIECCKELLSVCFGWLGGWGWGKLPQNWCQNQSGLPKTHQSHFSLGLTIVSSNPCQMCGAFLEASLQLPMGPGRGGGSCQRPEGGTSQKSTDCSVRSHSQKHQLLCWWNLKATSCMEVHHLSLLTLVTCIHWTL